MKFTCTVDIDLPLDRVVALFDNDDNLRKWQPGFVSKEHLSGTPGTVGATSRIIFDSGKHVMVLRETIQSNNLPAEITALYEHEHMTNTMRTCFASPGPGRTRMDIHIEYTRFNGFVPTMMALLLPGVFKRQTQKMFDSFKAFGEGQR